MSDDPDRKRRKLRITAPWAEACFEAAWLLGAAAMCGVFVKRLGWGKWSFLGLPAFLILSAIWLRVGRRLERLRPNNREELSPPVNSPADTPAAELDGDGAQDRQIRIIKTPRGAAPEWVREAWVGLRLPLGDYPPGDPRLLRRFGVTSYWRKRFFPWTAARFQPADFFPVHANKAIAVLQKTQPDAAGWWTENTPHLLHPTARLIFRRDECELEP
jgi:hypothetical protein